MKTKIQNYKQPNIRLLCLSLISLFPYFLIPSYAQSAKIDSLQKLLLTQKEDTDKINLLNELSKQLISKGYYDKAKKYVDNAVTICEKIGFKKGKANAYDNMGRVFMYQGNYPEALKNEFASLKIREEIKDKSGIAGSYRWIGYIYYWQGNYLDALKEHLGSLKIREEIGDKKGIADSYNSIGIDYLNLADSERDSSKRKQQLADALKNYFACLKISEEIGDKQLIAASYGNAGLIYMIQHNYADALNNDFSCLKIMKEIGDKNGIGASYNNIGIIYEKQGNYSDALKNYFFALKMSEELEIRGGIAYSYVELGKVYIKLRKLSEAKKYLNDALSLSKEIGSKEDTKESYSGLAELDSTEGNWKGAVENYKMYIVYRDSLLNEENTKKTVRIEMQYDFDKKETQAKAEQDKKDAVAVAESRKQRIILYSVIGGLLLVILFAGFIYRSLIQIKKKNILITAQKKKIEEKQKEILDSIHYAKRIQDAILPRESYIEKTLRRLKKLPPMS